MVMGKRNPVDKAISPAELIKALASGSITIAQAQQIYNGVIPIGDFRGIAALFDLDLLVKQPLVDAERRHILGILDGREEDYDLQTLGITAGEAIETNHDASLVIPTGEVWFVEVVRGYVPATVTCSIDFQWYCDLWPDHAGTAPSGFGQAFNAAVLNNGVGGPWTYDAEFDEQGPLWAPTNKHVALRLPGGTTVKVRFTTRTAGGEAISCTFQLFGFIGKALVD